MRLPPLAPRGRLLALLSCLTVTTLLVGCSRHTLTIETADVINTWGGDETASALEVDIVMLTPAETRAHPELLRRKVRSDEWFRLRDAGTPPLGLPPERILALRAGPERPDADRLIGGALISGRDQPGGSRPRVIELPHPAPYDEQSALLIFGRYNTEAGLASNPPVVIQPLPSRFEDGNITIRAERKQLSRRY